MKLRFSAYFQQLLIIGGSLFLLASHALAQIDADIVVKGEGMRVKVVGVSGTALVVRTENGDRPIPLADVTRVTMAAPAELAQGQQAFQAKDYAKALGFVKGVADRFRGLPTPWAQQAAAMLVEVHLALGDTGRAEVEYGNFTKAYPTGGSTAGEVIGARIAIAKKNLPLAKQKLTPITEAALKDKTLGGANALAYSQAFLASGQLKEAESNFGGALEDYLRSVTIFYHDRAAAAQAQERADALRSQHPEITVP